MAASLRVTRWPRHACTRCDWVNTSRVVQPFCVVYKIAGFMFQRSFWSFVVVCSFQISSGNDIHHMTEGDFHWSCCAISFSIHLISWEKSWMFCENWHLAPDVSDVNESALSVLYSPSLLCIKNASLLFQRFFFFIYFKLFWPHAEYTFYLKLIWLLAEHMVYFKLFWPLAEYIVYHKIFLRNTHL